MSEITKMLAAVGLLAGGFFSASLFGTPAENESRTATGEWAPERLEPIDNAGLVPSTASATWDQQVAAAAHNQSDRAGDTFAVHQAARPEWPEPPSTSPPGLLSTGLNEATAIPEIRREPSSAAEPAGSGFEPFARGDERVASLEPPPLLPGSSMNVALRPSKFPERPLDATPPIATQRMQSGGGSGNAWGNTATISGGPSMAPLATTGEPIWHVVSDGDSLAKIAERYLSDANRAREIYELNRDLLTSPDLLPIGAELRIPQTASASRQFEVFDSSGASGATYEPQSRLVPLPELPASVREMPRARLQGPVSASMAGTP